MSVEKIIRYVSILGVAGLLILMALGWVNHKKMVTECHKAGGSVVSERLGKFNRYHCEEPQ